MKPFGSEGVSQNMKWRTGVQIAQKANENASSIGPPRALWTSEGPSKGPAQHRFGVTTVRDVEYKMQIKTWFLVPKKQNAKINKHPYFSNVQTNFELQIALFRNNRQVAERRERTLAPALSGKRLLPRVE
jgi:hypothetical protein